MLYKQQNFRTIFFMKVFNQDMLQSKMFQAIVECRVFLYDKTLVTRGHAHCHAICDFMFIGSMYFIYSIIKLCINSKHTHTFKDVVYRR